MTLKNGRISEWSDLKNVRVVIMEYESNAVVDTPKPGEQYDAVRVVVYDRMKDEDVTEDVEDEILGVKKERKGEGEWEVCLVTEYIDENVFVWAREVVSSKRTSDYAHIPIEYFATYFDWDPSYAEKDARNAPSSAVTGADVLSFGSQKFKLSIEGKVQKAEEEHKSKATSSTKPSKTGKNQD